MPENCTCYMREYIISVRDGRDETWIFLHVRIWFPLRIMGSLHVRCQGRPPCKRLVACRIFAHIRSLSCMCPPMSSQATRITKRPSTPWIFAEMRFLPRMYPLVHTERGSLKKRKRRISQKPQSNDQERIENGLIE